MTQLLLLLTLTTMLTSALVIFILKSKSNKALCRKLSEATSWLAFILGVAFSVSYFQQPSLNNHSHFLQITALQAIVVPYILMMGVLVKRFSYHYLQSDSAYDDFFLKIKLLMTCLLVFVASNHFILVGSSWIVSGWLMALLIRHTQTPAAIQSSQMAFKTFLIGDALLLSSLIGLFYHFNSPFFSQWIKEGAANSYLLIVSTLFVVIGCMSKTALLPFHRWLPNTLSAPTPVSAIMHAGFVNAGAILFAKLSSVLIVQPWVMNGLVIVGLISAILGSAAMLVQTDVKRYLTFSTIGQMGFMVVECGLGAFHLAIGHLIVHGLFKARLFLASGSVIEHRRSIRNVAITLQQKKANPILPWALLAGVVLSTTIAVSLGFLSPFIRHYLLNLHPLLLLVIVLAVVFSGLALQQSKGVTILSVLLSSLFGLVLMLGYGFYETFSERYLQFWSMTAVLSGSFFIKIMVLVLGILAIFTFLALAGFSVLPKSQLNRLYMMLLNASEEKLSLNSIKTTFAHRTAG